MLRDHIDLDGSYLVVERNVPAPGDLAIVERKGLGHPDTLADHLAESLSRAYGRYTRREFGVVLHHNFDKLSLLGGSCEVRYGAGRMVDPVRVLVNGRVARSCGGVSIPVDDLIAGEVRGFFADRIPELDGHVSIEMNVTSNPSPGAVLTGQGSTDRGRWFAPRSIDDLRERRQLLANDTSLGTGWAPENRVERFVRTLTDHFSSPDGFRASHPWCGSDVKVMAHGVDRELDVVLAVPQKCEQVTSRAEYLENKDAVLAECRRIAERSLPEVEARFHLNARDLPERDELYLTYTGSSIESGDEGVVGRGNRVNGLITPLRPMNVEGVSGKNPVYHVGKLYNVAADRIAQRLFEATGAPAEVHLVSATGQRLDRPWRIVVRLAEGGDELANDKLRALLLETLDTFPLLTDEIISGDGPATA
ncbi:methionine adenosyltransferase [Amycolatopsis palatopharyngis]|uniref:methionine adenosyltransferase n=1 Tax=Amycolatopsis palatopharyngis TaxID=187982 RepID=UPI000E271087|nr:methionine adenosyltransferase [Amycolatopsis palatopharyngis]